MAVITAVDVRRMDMREISQYSPVWVTSAEVSCVTGEDKGTMLFSFPTAGGDYFLHAFVLELTAACTASTTIDIGLGTLATNAVTTGGDVTIVDADEYIPTADITIATPGWYPPISGDFFTALTSSNVGGVMIVKGAASTVPCIYATIAKADGAILAGTFRLHVLMSRLP